MPKMSLQELSAAHAGKLSDKWSLYLSEYDRLFAPISEAPVRLLEIGIQNGGSLELWSKYFPNAVAIVGSDINPDCAALEYADPRVSVVVGDANDPAIHAEILARAAEFDIVIDDGSHVSSDIVKSFALYFPKLPTDGIFIAEDLHCSYWKGFEGGLYDPFSSISFFKLLADVVNHEHWGVPTSRRDLLAAIFQHYDCKFSEDDLATIYSIEFINSACIVRKSRDKATLGHRVISGSIEAVKPGHAEFDGKPYQLDPICDQTGNPWSNRPQSPVLDLIDIGRAFGEDCPSPGLADEITKLRQQHAELQLRHRDLDLRHQHLEHRHRDLERIKTEILNSFSWRITDLPRRLLIRIRSWRR